ncbi:MAG: PAS domain S-box protein [Candidatus Hermodarchaeota archaeon]
MEKMGQLLEKNRDYKSTIRDKKDNLKQKLKDSEKKFQVLFNNSTSGIAYHRMIYDEDQNPVNYIITDVNLQYEEILSINKKDIINKPSTEVYNVEQAPYLEIFSNVASTQKSFSFESYFAPMDKYFKISVISSQKGEFITIFNDISDRIRSELKLKESEEKYRYLFEDTPFAIALLDFNGNFLECNSYVQKIFGFKRKDLIGKNFNDVKIVPKKNLPMITNGFETISKGQIPRPKEIQLLNKNGKLIWVLLHISVIKRRNMNLIQVIVEDITERKQSEQKIIESEEKFRTITEQSFIGIAILQDFQFRYVNKQFSDTLGYTSEEILKWKPKEFFKIIHPDDRQMVYTLAEEKYYGTNGILANLQFRIFKKTNEVIWLEIISKNFSYNGKSADLVATLNITEKREAERIVLEENKKLLELNKMRKDIITRVSHELKTPLTSIYGASQILVKHLREKLEDDVLNFVEISHRGAIRLKKLVENLIDASRIETGKLILKMSIQNISNLVRECVDEMKYLTYNRKQIINLKLPEEIYFYVDKIRLQQVITNILSNAIKNTPKSGSIDITLSENTDYIDIKIKDAGIGLTEKEKKILFEKFGKIERYGMDLGVDLEGSGLGLYISKEIIESHGGHILVESKGRHQGAIFTVRLFKN